MLATYIGIDGFRWGWVAAIIDDNGGQRFDYSQNIRALLSIQFKRAMIDIPIGLPNAGSRLCDLQAKEILGSSVFPGARRNLWKFQDYAAANKHYWSTEGLKSGISQQLWGIRNKIKEVDELVSPDNQGLICETHPELVFLSLAHGEKLWSKKTATGRQQRIEILKRVGFIRIEDWLGQRFGTGICQDDLIDACVCAVAARDAKSVLGNNEYDSRGLRMEMHY